MLIEGENNKVDNSEGEFVYLLGSDKLRNLLMVQKLKRYTLCLIYEWKEHLVSDIVHHNRRHWISHHPSKSLRSSFIKLTRKACIFYNLVRESPVRDGLFNREVNINLLKVSVNNPITMKLYIWQSKSLINASDFFHMNMFGTRGIREFFDSVGGVRGLILSNKEKSESS